MSKIKIRVIDSNHKRRRDICLAVKDFNSLDNACIESCWDENNKNKWLTEKAVAPNLFLLHINDQKEVGTPFIKYLKNVNDTLSNALIVLYSAGRISVTEHSKRKINITQNNNTWEFDVENGDQFCIVKRNINSASDLNITAALKNYLATSSKDDFFKLILDIGKPHLIALSILCQGYLAANEEHLKDEITIIKLPEGITISKDKKDNTIKRDWWKPALGNEYKGNELKNELETVDKDKKDAIECLMGIIENGKEKKDGNEIVYFENGEATDSHRLAINKIIEDFTGKVNVAYGQLKNILGATK